MNFDIESKSREFFGGGRIGWWGEMCVPGRVQLSCGHVDIDRMVIHDDNPNEGYF